MGHREERRRRRPRAVSRATADVFVPPSKRGKITRRRQ